jgi:hypothetical protein
VALLAAEEVREAIERRQVRIALAPARFRGPELVKHRAAVNTVGVGEFRRVGHGGSAIVIVATGRADENEGDKREG